jgi:hypothetical protein
MRTYKTVRAEFDKRVEQAATEYLERALDDRSRDSVKSMVSDQIRDLLNDRLGFGPFDSVREESPLYDVLMTMVNKIAKARAKPIIDKLEKNFRLNKRQEAAINKSFTDGYEEVMNNVAYEAGKLKAESDKTNLLKSMRLT